MLQMYRFLIFFLFFSTSFSQKLLYGFDTSLPMGVANLACLNNAGYVMPIYRLYVNDAVDCNGVVNENLNCTTCTGITPEWGVYIYPCTQSDKCSDASEQVRRTICGLEVPNKPGWYIYVQHVWIDVEGNLWSNNKTENQEFIMEMIDAIIFNEYHAGIYTNYYYWDEIVGANWSVPADMELPLWWARYNNVPDLTTNWTSFGGWESPYIHQYAGNEVICGVKIDKNVVKCNAQQLCGKNKKDEKKLIRNPKIINACLGMPNPCYSLKNLN